MFHITPHIFCISDIMIDIVHPNKSSTNHFTPPNAH
jgi:hypothetical protein